MGEEEEKYIVMFERRAAGMESVGAARGPHSFFVYLVALEWKPYEHGSSGRLDSLEREDAFVFKTRAAAEMAAVWVGGEVVRWSETI